MKQFELFDFEPPPEEPEIQPAAVMPKLIRRVRDLFGLDVELDFSWADDAIIVCDMRVPSALRYSILYTRTDIQKSLGKFPDLSSRIQKFMGQ